MATSINATACAAPTPPPISTGYEADLSGLPPARVDVPLELRLRAALLISAMTKSLYPEDLTDGVPADVAAAFEADELERTLCLDWLDLLLNTLAPLSGREV